MVKELFAVDILTGTPAALLDVWANSKEALCFIVACFYLFRDGRGRQTPQSVNQGIALTVARVCGKPFLILAFTAYLVAWPVLAASVYDGLLNKAIFVVVGVGGFAYLWHHIQPTREWHSEKFMVAGYLLLLWSVGFGGFALAGILL